MLNEDPQKVVGSLFRVGDYYPIGLTMAGISSKALKFGMVENKYKFNGIEQSNEFDINMYDAHFRNLDSQIGKFWQIDPKLEGAEGWSPYAAMLNNPIRYADPLGDSSVPGYWQGVSAGFKGYFQNIGNKIQSNFANPSQAIREGLSPSNALNNLAQLSPITQLVNATKTGNSFFNNLAEGKNFEAGQIGGQKLGEGTLSLATMAVTDGIVRGLKVGPAASAEVNAANQAPGKVSFIVDANGQAFPVPAGATGPTTTPSGKGVQFTGGSGGTNGQVATMRIMDPVPARGNASAYPEGYIKYENASGQGVNPYTGRTGSKPETHCPINAWEFTTVQ